MFVVECLPDDTLVSYLASVGKRRVDHAGGKSMVLRKLMRNYKNSIGIIDQDPNRTQPPDIQRFRQLESSERNKLKVLQHTRRNNRLIVICPRLEEWIVEAAREANVDLRRYNLPNDPIELHEIINIRIEEFRQLVKELGNSSNRVKALRTNLRGRT